ncbi:DUF4198 domain-containing protein [Pseudoxanthomonas sp. z9]|uniref:DUF4198 domain-containing protein n=1 Tax=Pseudoxanthomonas sp. z9 TaxID=2584942 RepID=UPI00114484AF|nr:DUF4198 domain-containing protein [Pseudoxanthomonas sp. z9]MCL6713196.1 DUF4198 domain-containing protein [Pseudomonas sp. R2.Fl]
MIKHVLQACLALAIVGAGPVHSHDLFVAFPDSPVKPGEAVSAHVNNGTFEESAGPVTPSRLRDVTFLQAGQRSHPDAARWKAEGKQSRLSLTPATAGTAMLGVSTQPTVSERSASEFATYLKLEDLPDTLASYDPARYPKGVRYAYAKHARAILQSGEARTDDYADSLDYPLEIRLSRHPATVAPGERLGFEVLYRGKPVSGLRVHVGRGTEAAGGPAPPAQLLRTDAQGRGEFEVTKAAIWYIHTNRMEPTTEDGLDFISDRASLTFHVGAH